MRSEEEIMNLILSVATSDDRIRAVLLTGSRANPNTAKDIFQDFDITYVVTNLEPYITNHSWIDVFGERLILQMPDEMTIGEKDVNAFHYLMLFSDGNRIDLTLFPLDTIESKFERDPFTIVLLDKDRLSEKFASLHVNKFLITPPRQQQFTDCCNEFWWVCTYVAKGLFRDEITYSKEMLELHVRVMFYKMIEWNIGIETGFAVSIGKGGRHIQQYLDKELYNKILSTYSDADPKNIWNALFVMTELVADVARKIAQKMSFNYNQDEEDNVIQYLKRVQTIAGKNNTT